MSKLSKDLFTQGGVLDRPLIVTTSGRPTPELIAEAQSWAQRLGVPFAPRRGSLPALLDEHGVAGALVITPQGPVYREPARGLEYFFHPSAAKLRLHNCLAGREDPMLRAMQLQPGDSVLDCTLGRAADALLAAWKVGPHGRVVGLEKSRLLAEMTIYGLAHYVDPSRELTALLRRIEAYCGDYRCVLPRLPNCAFSVVYFDPLFAEPLAGACAMAPLRALADPSPLTPEAVEEARRVATRCVVIKQPRGSTLWRHWATEIEIVAGKKAHIEYGVLPARE